MIDTVVVSCRKNNYYLSPNGDDYKVGDIVIFEGDDDLLYGKVIKSNYKEKKKNLDLPLFNIVRVINKDDKKKIDSNKSIEEKALKEATKISKDLELDMSFADVFYTFNRKQMIFSFVADNRIDFRNLAKKLANKYKTRIELRQIGVRDKARLVGGIGPCGLFLCCNKFLTEFSSVSINMAKNQNLALNHTKINGLCGRLYCCLDYENDTYTELKKGFPKIGDSIKNKYGEGKVISINLLNRSYKVDFGENGIIELESD